MLADLDEIRHNLKADENKIFIDSSVVVLLYFHRTAVLQNFKLCKPELQKAGFQIR